jgi:arylformamidase
MIIPISYPLHRATPLYPGTPPIALQPFKSIERGDSTNATTITLHSHSGTHIDLPRHFCPGGGSVSTLFAPETIFEPAYCIEVQKSGDVPLRVEDLLPHLSKTRDAQALLIKTGCGKTRATMPETYASEHPWVHPAVPGVLRQECPDLRLFGIDTVSVAIPSHREEGRKSHRAFLCESPPIFLLEDVNLSNGRLTEGSWQLRLYPILFDDLDGVPVIALAEVPG